MAWSQKFCLTPDSSGILLHSRSNGSLFLTGFAPRQRFVECSCTSFYMQMTLLWSLSLTKRYRTSATNLQLLASSLASVWERQCCCISMFLSIQQSRSTVAPYVAALSIMVDKFLLSWLCSYQYEFFILEDVEIKPRWARQQPLSGVEQSQPWTVF